MINDLNHMIYMIAVISGFLAGVIFRVNKSFYKLETKKIRMIGYASSIFGLLASFCMWDYLSRHTGITAPLAIMAIAVEVFGGYILGKLVVEAEKRMLSAVIAAKMVRQNRKYKK